MKQPLDRQPSRRALGDASGRNHPERFSEYFDFTRFPEKAEKKVTRHELNAILTQYDRARRSLTWHSRLWRFLKAPLGSGPVKAVPDAE